MSKNGHFLLNAFSSLFAGAPKAPAVDYASVDLVGEAQAKLAKGICPRCDTLASFEAVDIDHRDSCQHSTEMCRNCGAKFLMSTQGHLLDFKGHDDQIYAVYRRDLEVEARRREATLALEGFARRAA
jgi:hypothetical protein